MIRLELLTLCAFLLVTKTLMAREAEDTSLKRRVVSVLAKFLERHKLSKFLLTLKAFKKLLYINRTELVRICQEWNRVCDIQLYVAFLSK